MGTNRMPWDSARGARRLSPEWVRDCLQVHGRVLQGKYSHWCPEWDGMPIDETCMEWTVCVCGGTSGHSGGKCEGQR